MLPPKGSPPDGSGLEGSETADLKPGNVLDTSVSAFFYSVFTTFAFLTIHRRYFTLDIDIDIFILGKALGLRCDRSRSHCHFYLLVSETEIISKKILKRTTNTFFVKIFLSLSPLV